ncbi:MAG: FkbM family methyltransferase [Bacteroidales bacterium]|jgi:FkbM family methyltransferase
MKTIKETKEEFKNGKIEKADFISKMHDIHKYLFEYSEVIKDTDISKIEISDDSVVMTIRDSGIKLICDKNDKRIIPIEIINFNSFEKEELKFINELVKEETTILDIGANIGWYSLNLSKKFNNIKIHAFEPVSKTFNYLNSNLSINNITNVKTYNFGFSDEEKNIDIYCYPECMGNSSLANLSGNSSVEKINCKFTKVDLFVKQNNLKIDFIKCDVEGAELLVFKGAIETLKKDKPVVFTEILRKWSAKFNYHPNDILALFSNIGYNCYVIRNNNLEKFEKVDDSTLETNYIFIHKDKK